jgi:hypothetical protein
LCSKLLFITFFFTYNKLWLSFHSYV